MICTVYRSQIIWLWALLNQIWLLSWQKGTIIMLSQKEHINSIVLEFEMHISVQKYICISKLLRIQICFCRTNYQTIFRISKYWSCQDGLNTETRENTSIYVLGRSLGFAFLPANQTYVVIKTMGPKLFLSCIFK